VSDYESIRQFADSYGLAAMVVVFAIFALWVFRPGARRHYDEAARTIFTEAQDGQTADKDMSHG
jgi:cytochrome c oxidase cbb3-type subunit 4